MLALSLKFAKKQPPKTLKIVVVNTQPPHCRFTLHPRWTPRISACVLYFQNLESLGYILSLIVWSSFNFLQLAPKNNRVRIGSSRSTKVDDFRTNRKRICDFLLGRHSNFGPSYLAPFLRYGNLLAEIC